MTILYILLILIILLFKQQAKALLEAAVKLIVAIADAIVKSIK